MQLGQSLCNCSSRQIFGWESDLKGYSGLLGVEHSLGDADNTPSICLGIVSTVPSDSLPRVGYSTKERRWGGEELPKCPAVISQQTSIWTQELPSGEELKTELSHSATVERMCPVYKLGLQPGGSRTSPRMWPTHPFHRHSKSGYWTLLLISRDSVWEILRAWTRRKTACSTVPASSSVVQPGANCSYALIFQRKIKIRPQWRECCSGSRAPVYHAQGLLLGSEGRRLGNSRSFSAT